jgi:hypothetical protein
MKSKFFIFVEGSGLLVEGKVVLFDGIGNLIVEGRRFVFREPFFLGILLWESIQVAVLSDVYLIYNL